MPPHYDAVSALAVCGRSLYSACGVTIKLWDVKRHTLELVCPPAFFHYLFLDKCSVLVLCHGDQIIFATYV